MSTMHEAMLRAVRTWAPDLEEDFVSRDFDSEERTVGPLLAAWLHRRVTHKIVWMDVHQYEFLAYLRVALESRKASAERARLSELDA